MSIYLYHYDFPATRGNHTGMSYISRQLAASQADVFEIEQRKFAFKGGELFRFIDSMFMALWFTFKLKTCDYLVLVEFGTPKIQQHYLAKWLRILGAKFTLIGFAHLAKSHFLEHYLTSARMVKVFSLLDGIITLGHTLKDDLQSIGLGSVVSTTLPVDIEYYHPGDRDYHGKLNVVVVGSLKRNRECLPKIIQALPEVHFHVFLGRNGVLNLDSRPQNLSTYGFVCEAELAQLMAISHVSLSIMEDTIGSNAITCSLAMGLVNVVTDIGSIRDYCSESNSILCSTIQTYIEAIDFLDHNRMALIQLSQNARVRAEEISLESFCQTFHSLISEFEQNDCQN